MSPAQTTTSQVLGNGPENHRRPLLSIGLPVYNGSLHLEDALDSLLAQDVGDFELVISDNASTDATPEICARYAARDPRVRYTRTDSNIGAAKNFNRAFELCSGEYFMWGSDDDIWSPEFASACIERLAANPNAVLCTSQVQFISDDGTELPTSYEPLDTQGLDSEERVLALLRRSVWYDMYSVFRPEALRRTDMYAPTFGGDVHLLTQLAFLGDFLAVPDTLFRYRIPEKLKELSEMSAEIGVAAGARDQFEEPMAFLARNTIAVIEERSPDSGSARRLIARFTDFLESRGSSWGTLILRERGWSAVPPRWVVGREIRAAIQGEAMPSFLVRSFKVAFRLVVPAGRGVKRAWRTLAGGVRS